MSNKRTKAHRAADARYNKKRGRRIVIELNEQEEQALMAKMKNGATISATIKRLIRQD